MSSPPSAAGAPHAADAQYYRELLEPVFAGKPFILLGGTLAALASFGRQLRALGAARPFLLAAHSGAGEPPDESEAAHYSLEVRAPDMLRSIWCFESALARLPAAARAALDAWDPEQRAQALGVIVMTDVKGVAGRPRYARRPSAWLALEDKTRSPAFFDAIGLRRGPQAIVRAELAALRAASGRLDRGMGTVWAGDTALGVHGGAVFVRWVRDERSEQAAFELLAGCERVRVMPFVEGVPCSVHGIVFGSGVAVFRPIEMLTLRLPDEGRFVYASSASYWDPPQGAGEALRAAARRVGEGLRRQLDYRGAFTLDGVMGPDGFVPTELNPRIGAGFRHLCGASGELPLYLLALAAAQGEELDYRPEELEQLVLDTAAANRSGAARVMVPARYCGERSQEVVECAGEYRPANPGEDPAGTLRSLPAPSGGAVSFEPAPGAIESGPAFGPRAARALALADRVLGARVGPLEACRPDFR